MIWAGFAVFVVLLVVAFRSLEAEESNPEGPKDSREYLCRHGFDFLE